MPVKLILNGVEVLLDEKDLLTWQDLPDLEGGVPLLVVTVRLTTLPQLPAT